MACASRALTRHTCAMLSTWQGETIENYLWAHNGSTPGPSCLLRASKAPCVEMPYIVERFAMQRFDLLSSAELAEFLHPHWDGDQFGSSCRRETSTSLGLSWDIGKNLWDFGVSKVQTK